MACSDIFSEVPNSFTDVSDLEKWAIKLNLLADENVQRRIEYLRDREDIQKCNNIAQLTRWAVLRGKLHSDDVRCRLHEMEINRKLQHPKVSYYPFIN